MSFYKFSRCSRNAIFIFIQIFFNVKRIFPKVWKMQDSSHTYIHTQNNYLNDVRIFIWLNTWFNKDFYSREKPCFSWTFFSKQNCTPELNCSKNVKASRSYWFFEFQHRESWRFPMKLRTESMLSIFTFSIQCLMQAHLTHVYHLPSFYY